MSQLLMVLLQACVRVVPFAGRACLKLGRRQKQQELEVYLGRLPTGTLTVEASLLETYCGGNRCRGAPLSRHGGWGQRGRGARRHVLAVGYRRLGVGQKGTPGHRDAAPSLPATRNAPATS